MCIRDSHTTRLTPFEPVYYFVGTKPGAIPLGASLAIADPLLLGVFTAGTTCRISLSSFLDRSFAGLTFLFQALELANCKLSDLVTHTF